MDLFALSIVIHNSFPMLWFEIDPKTISTAAEQMLRHQKQGNLASKKGNVPQFWSSSPGYVFDFVMSIKGKLTTN